MYIFCKKKIYQIYFVGFRGFLLIKNLHIQGRAAKSSHQEKYCQNFNFKVTETCNTAMERPKGFWSKEIAMGSIISLTKKLWFFYKTKCKTLVLIWGVLGAGLHNQRLSDIRDFSLWPWGLWGQWYETISKKIDMYP